MLSADCAVPRSTRSIWSTRSSVLSAVVVLYTDVVSSTGGQKDLEAVGSGAPPTTQYTTTSVMWLRSVNVTTKSPLRLYELNSPESSTPSVMLLMSRPNESIIVVLAALPRATLVVVTAGVVGKATLQHSW